MKTIAKLCFYSGLLLSMGACSTSTMAEDGAPATQGKVFSTFEYKTPMGKWKKL